MSKLRVYLNEYNVLMENTIYLPLASGQLRAFAETKPEIREAFEFMPFLFIRGDPDQIVRQYDNPAVAGFSCSMWNVNLSLAVAERVKAKFPECLIVLGGPSVPLESADFFASYPFIDVTVRGEGEQTFSELLIRFMERGDFRGLPGISYLDQNEGRIIKNEDRPLEENPDVFPSPYLEGLYDYLLPTGINFQAIIETNRGCPFWCSYCFWGVGKHYRLFSLERARKLAGWCGANKIKYVFCADSNFGMLDRDVEIAEYFVQSKAKYGCPEKFRACYGKNAEETIYKIGKLLHEHDMEKGITLSRQSNNAETLRNVGRKNVKQSVYDNLQRRYNEQQIPTYTELILGLPGETYHSFLNGMEEILQSGIKNQLIVYICEVYPNTELASPEYRKRFGITTVRIPLTEIHGSVRLGEIPQEYNKVVVSTTSMSISDWKRALVISWIMQLLHGLKLGFYILLYLVERYHIKYTDFFLYLLSYHPEYERAGPLAEAMVYFCHIANGILGGDRRGQDMSYRGFGKIYWEPEEAWYLTIVDKLVYFYDEMYQACREFLGIKDDLVLKEVIEYQKARIPHFLYPEKQEYSFKYNIPEYFDKYFTNRCELTESPQKMTLVDVKDYRGDKETFAREVILYGRKSDKMLYPVRWAKGSIGIY